MLTRSLMVTAGLALLLAGPASATVPVCPPVCSNDKIHVSFEIDTGFDDFAAHLTNCSTSPCLQLKNFLLVQTEKSKCEFLTCVGFSCGKFGPFTLPLTNTGCPTFNKAGCLTGGCCCHDNTHILHDGKCSRFCLSVCDLGPNDCDKQPAFFEFCSVSGGFSECGSTLVFNDCNPFGTAVFHLDSGDAIDGQLTFTISPAGAGVPEVDATEAAAPIAALVGSLLLACDRRQGRNIAA